MKLKFHIPFFYVGAIILMLYACAGTSKQESVTVFAAASLQNVLSEFKEKYEFERKVNVRLNFASSGVLARQISQGASVDIYLSANKSWADYLDSLSLIIPYSKQNVAKNSLVLVQPKSTNPKVNFTEFRNELRMNKDLKIAIGNPQYVPAGKYAKEAFEYFKMYDSITTQLVFTKDVRSALLIAELAEVEYAVVYKTDAIKSNKILIIHSFPEESHSEISYFVEQCSTTKAGANFIEFLLAPANKLIWEKYGFVV